MDEALETALRELYDNAQEGALKVFTARANSGKTIKDQFVRNKVDIKTPYNLRRSYCRDLMEGGVDPKTYEYYCGHSLAVALKHYQSWDELRAQKAAPKILEALKGSDENSTTYFTTYSPHNLQHRDISQHPAICNNENDFSLENRRYYRETKKPREIIRGALIGAEGFEPPTKGL